MTDQEWLTCTDLNVMLGFLHGKASDRKLRLFAVGCCRQIWRQIKSHACQQAVESSELFADGLLDDKRLRNAERRVAEEASLLMSEASLMMRLAKYAQRDAARAVVEVARKRLNPAGVAYLAAEAMRFAPGRAKDQCSLLRDLFPKPFRWVPSVNPTWLTWHDYTILKLAQAIYDERDFVHLPILADALEEAGCDNADILNHCRQPGEHVRGCWVVDLLLDKS
ncbi:MAG TPA: hypothetical protein VH682_06225 [Gemmataceae bacterium]